MVNTRVVNEFKGRRREVMKKLWDNEAEVNPITAHKPTKRIQVLNGRFLRQNRKTIHQPSRPRVAAGKPINIIKKDEINIIGMSREKHRSLGSQN